MLAREKLKRPSALLIATAMTLAVLVPALMPASASAYGLLGSRQIKMSDSTLGATSVAYEVSFKPAATSTVKSIAVDFCQNNPIINDSCTGTVGTNTPTISSATVTTTGGANNLSALTWTVTITNSNQTFTIANSTGASLTAGTTYTFTINGVTNPTDNDTGTAGNQPGTFYSRILTFPNDATSDYAGGYTQTNVGTNVPTDAGGIALSTAQSITVTSKVQERLNFCVYTGANCAAGGNAVALGDANGVLDPNGAYVDKNTQYDISTNAANGAAVRIKGDTLKSGSFSISALTSATASSPGSEQFGFCTYEPSANGLTPTAPYNSGSCSSTTQTAGANTPGGDGGATFALDTNATTGTTSTYGQQFVTKAAGSTSTGVIAFLGNISNTTEAAIYTTTLQFIATGTY